MPPFPPFPPSIFPIKTPPRPPPRKTPAPSSPYTKRQPTSPQLRSSPPPPSPLPPPPPRPRVSPSPSPKLRPPAPPPPRKIIPSPPPPQYTSPSQPQITPSSSSIRTTKLWGMNGELWTPGGRLTDYSYAGYMGNDVPIPFNPVTDSVKNYGAVGDGVVDDSRAFLAAIASLKPGSVLFVPAGALLPGRERVACGRRRQCLFCSTGQPCLL